MADLNPILDPIAEATKRAQAASQLANQVPGVIPGLDQGAPGVAPVGVDPTAIGSPDMAMAEPDVGEAYKSAVPGGEEGGLGWKEGLEGAQLAAGAGGGVLEALGAAGSGESAYNLPGSSSDQVGLSGVASPFSTGKMKAADRQSIALALLR